jgi:hypothetical protein
MCARTLKIVSAKQAGRLPIVLSTDALQQFGIALRDRS